ncbi:hypothetical protein EDC96DRAFT_485269 [Choanephora cucurbitarum]|nr:hypothetical protein EDC96DRAFT_485269 [Choanephora cucurbitarum]
MVCLDITSVKIKYEEGFADLLGRIFTKPEIMWTKADRNLVVPTEYSLCIGFSLQTGTLVLLQCFWNYLSNSVAKKSFMSSKEFMFYICWTFSSFIIFPLLQYNFSRDVYEATYKEIIPEMVYGIELFIVACLGVVSHFRFKKLLRSSRNTVNGRSIQQKVLYFQEINIILSTVLFGHGTLLTILSCDGLTKRKFLNIHKFTADFFICNINMCAVITWLCMILIFHPKHNLSPEANSDENTDDSQRPLNNQSGLSSANTFPQSYQYGQARSMSEYPYPSVHPLSKQEVSVADTFNHPFDNSFKYPIYQADLGYYRDKNNSIASSIPSVSTIVSRQPSYSSKLRLSKALPSRETAADLFQPIPDSDRRKSYAIIHPLSSPSDDSFRDLTSFQRDEDITIPPILPPVRKRSEPIIHHPDFRRYTNSVAIPLIDEDLEDFGVYKKAGPSEEQPQMIDIDLESSLQNYGLSSLSQQIAPPPSVPPPPIPHNCN